MHIFSIYYITIADGYRLIRNYAKSKTAALKVKSLNQHPLISNRQKIFMKESVEKEKQEKNL